MCAVSIPHSESSEPFDLHNGELPDDVAILQDMATAFRSEVAALRAENNYMRASIDEHVEETRASDARARYDRLTGLLSDTGLEEAYNRFSQNELRRSSDAPRTSTGLLFIDVDDLKRANEVLLHSGADELLERIGEELVKRLRETDIKGRRSGDEFIIFLPDTDPEDAFQVAEALRKLIALLEVKREGEEPYRPTVSIGVDEVDPTKTYKFVADNADRAMTIAKRRGKNRVVSIRDIQQPPALTDPQQAESK